MAATAHGMSNTAMACRRIYFTSNGADSNTVSPTVRFGRTGRATRASVCRGAVELGSGAPRAAAEARSGVHLHVLLLILALGVCGQVLLVDHLGDILEMLLGQGCEVRVVAC